MCPTIAATYVSVEIFLPLSLHTHKNTHIHTHTHWYKHTQIRTVQCSLGYFFSRSNIFLWISIFLIFSRIFFFRRLLLPASDQSLTCHTTASRRVAQAPTKRPLGEHAVPALLPMSALPSVGAEATPVSTQEGAPLLPPPPSATITIRPVTTR
jgi:hypothetical protein